MPQNYRRTATWRHLNFQAGSDDDCGRDRGLRTRVQQDALSSYNKKERPRCPGPVPLVLSSSRLSASDQMFASCFWVYPATLLQFSLSRTILTHILSRHLGRGKTAPEVRCNQPGRPSSKDQVYFKFCYPKPFPFTVSQFGSHFVFGHKIHGLSRARSLSLSLFPLPIPLLILTFWWTDFRIPDC